MVKNVVVVDDRKKKRREILGYMEHFFPEAELFSALCADEFCTLVCCQHMQEVQEKPEEWLAVIDMRMPHEDSFNSAIDRECGYYVLKEMQCAGLKCPAIIVSSEVTDDVRAADCYASYKGSVEFSMWDDLTGDFREILAEYL